MASFGFLVLRSMGKIFRTYKFFQLLMQVTYRGDHKIDVMHLQIPKRLKIPGRKESLSEEFMFIFRQTFSTAIHLFHRQRSQVKAENWLELAQLAFSVPPLNLGWSNHDVFKWQFTRVSSIDTFLAWHLSSCDNFYTDSREHYLSRENQHQQPTQYS